MPNVPEEIVNNDDLLTTSQVASILDMTAEGIRYHCKVRNLDADKKDGVWAISKESVRALKMKHEHREHRNINPVNDWGPSEEQIQEMKEAILDVLEATQNIGRRMV